MRVRPILVRACYQCHTSSEMGGLRLDSPEALLRGGKSGPAIVPGEPERSLLIAAVRHTHERLKMPMGAERLADAEIDGLVAWIRAGAPWPEGPKPAAAPKAGEYAITAEQRA